MAESAISQIEAKGAVGHESNGRTFAFFPRLKEAECAPTRATGRAESVVRRHARQRRDDWPGRLAARVDVLRDNRL